MKPTPRNIDATIKKLYAARNELREAFPDLQFTLDGNLVGDMGEAIAIADFKFEKLRSGTKGHDFKSPKGKLVQVKATQQQKGGKGVGLGNKKTSFEHLIVLQIHENGEYNILYDGPGKYIDKARSHKKSPSMTVNQLRRTNLLVDSSERLIKS